MHVTREVDYDFNVPYVNSFIYRSYSMQLSGATKNSLNMLFVLFFRRHSVLNLIIIFDTKSRS